MVWLRTRRDVQSAVNSHHVDTAVTCTEQQHTSGRSRSSCYEFHPALKTIAADDPSVSQSVFTITEEAPTMAFSWLKMPTSAFTFKTLLRHYAKQMLTPL